MWFTDNASDAEPIDADFDMDVLVQAAVDNAFGVSAACLALPMLAKHCVKVTLDFLIIFNAQKFILLHLEKLRRIGGKSHKWRDVQLAERNS